MKRVCLCLLLLSACVHRNQRDYLPEEQPNRTIEEVLKDTVCTEALVSYTRCVKPILIARCYGCHSDTAQNKDRNEFVFFNQFSVLQAYARQSYVGRTEKKIQTHLKALVPFQFKPMPLTKLLPDAEIALIDAWIAKGAVE